MHSGTLSTSCALLLCFWVVSASAQEATPTQSPGPAPTTAPAPAPHSSPNAGEVGEEYSWEDPASDEGDSFGDAASARREEWYGWQILAVAGPSHLLLWSPVLLSDSSNGLVALPILGLTGIVFGGPTVHWAHGHVGTGFGSLGLNLGVPLVLGGLGTAICSSACATGGHWDLRGVVGFAIGAYVGTIAALAIDVSVLAFEPSESGSATKRLHPALELAPQLVLGRRSGAIGVLGTF